MSRTKAAKAGERPVERHGRGDALGRERGHRRRILAVVTRGDLVGARAARRDGVGGGQGQGAAHLVDHHQVVGVERPHHGAEGGAGRLVALGRPQRLFLRVQPSRRRMRHIVATLTRAPVASAHRRQCSS